MGETQKLGQLELTDAVDRERKRAGVRSLDLSFNELADMCRTGELHITPEYQRTFRWSAAKQSRFIESVVLEMPLPPVYAVEMKEDKWELIDGLQRLSTYLHLRGQLDLPERDPPIRKDENFLRLEGCDIVPALNGYLFAELPTSLQHRVRRATLRLDLVRRESNPRFAYYMFKRLNTGGEPLSDQEARNCSIRLLGTRFNDFIVELSSYDSFEACIEDITDEFRTRMGACELVLRFFAFKNNLEEYVHDIDPFLTDFMERVTDVESANHLGFDYTHERLVFSKTFTILAQTLGSKACRRWVGQPSYGGGFSISHFEAFSLGLARMVDEIPDVLQEDLRDGLTASMEEAKKEPELKALTTGGGKNFRRIYERKIQFVADRIRTAL
jgi:Protein of unknown function DUF262